MKGESAVECGYRACERDTRAWAGNFWLGIRLLPRDRRRALCAVYWFSQSADAAVDGDGTTEERAVRLEERRRNLDLALSGTPTTPRWAALEHATRRFGIQPILYDELLDGIAMDLEPEPFPDWPAVERYCHRVAGVVGLISLRVFGGAGTESERAAETLGHALQLTNILRDLRDDASRGRWYLPDDETRRFGVTPAAVAAGRAEPGFPALVLSVAERARAHYRAGAELYGSLPRTTRMCPAALAGVYRGLLERIAAEPAAPLGGPVSLPVAARLRFGLGGAAISLVA